ncbi:MAG TPA: cupredoxin domain-containing protein [Candidatus Saccharimonadales bacterium]|nr:cupredoxin domain-containing protein [Candidatus Saccharimonadales bacterium]
MKFFFAFLLSTGLFAAQESQPVPETFKRKPDRVVSIVAERFSFSPAKVTIKQGQHVEFVITSDDTDHGFRIPSANVNAPIPQQGKGELRIRFVGHEKGSYVFECSRPCGAGHNLMRGMIVVE